MNILIYRPQGDHPPRTKMGDLELGRVHSIDEKKAESYFKKGFSIVSAEEADAIRTGKPLAKPAPRLAPSPKASTKSIEGGK